MLLNSFLRTTMTATFSLLLFFGLGLGPVLIATGAYLPETLPAYDPSEVDLSLPNYDPWFLEFYYYDTGDGTSRPVTGTTEYKPTGCEIVWFRTDYITVTLHKRFRFIGWSNPDCKGELIFDIKGSNLTFFVPPKNFEAYQILWLGSQKWWHFSSSHGRDVLMRRNTDKENVLVLLDDFGRQEGGNGTNWFFFILLFLVFYPMKK